jgi:hypothetical protein
VKWIGEKIEAAVGRRENRQWTDENGQQRRGNLPCQAEMTAARRDLEYTVGVSRRLIVVIGIPMLVIDVVVMRFRRLLEEVVHLMGRRINQKKKE